jgi:ATP-binding cassette subfamily B protein
MSLYFYSFFLFGQLSLFGTVVKNYQEARANHDILEDIMSQSKEPETHHLPKLGTIQSLSFHEVSFAYGDSKNVLHNVSFKTTSGQTIAFVGQSGSGKSTILKLIAGLYPVQKGSVIYNDSSLQDIDTTDLKQRIGIVSQDAQLFT